MNASVANVSLAVSYAPLGFFKWQTQTQLESQWKTQQAMGLQAEGESDMIRSLLSDTK